MRNRQRGFTILEAVGALGIGSLMLVGLSSLIDLSLEDMAGEQAALHQAQVATAARKYLAAHYTDLLNATPGPGDVVAVDMATLKADRLLPDRFAAANAFNQEICVLVRQPNSDGKLDALVTTVGGKPIPDRSIAAMAAAAGAGSGYVMESDPGTARGASWSMPTDAYRGVACAGGGVALTGGAADGGHLVSSIFYDGPGQYSTDFLYRSEVPQRPELNKMNTPILMDDKAVVAEGDPCGGLAAVAVDASKSLMQCDADGKWSPVSTWKKPVGKYDDLPSTDPPGTVRMVMDQDAGFDRAFVYDANGTWVALAVDQIGDMWVPHDIRVGHWARVAGKVKSNVVQGKEVTILNQFNPGEECNIPSGNVDEDTGVSLYYHSRGTLVHDHSIRLMVCGWDNTFRYVNGTYDP